MAARMQYTRMLPPFLIILTRDSLKHSFNDIRQQVSELLNELAGQSSPAHLQKPVISERSGEAPSDFWDEDDFWYEEEWKNEKGTTSYR